MLAHRLIVEASSLLLLAWAVGRLVKLLFQALLFLLKAFLRRLLVLGFFRLRDRECKPVDLAALLRGLLVPLLQGLRHGQQLVQEDLKVFHGDE